MKTITKTIDELIESKDSPLPLKVIPNNMGINLNSVSTISWKRLESSNQLMNLTINFTPSNENVQ